VSNFPCCRIFNLHFVLRALRWQFRRRTFDHIRDHMVDLGGIPRVTTPPPHQRWKYTILPFPHPRQCGCAYSQKVGSYPFRSFSRTSVSVSIISASPSPGNSFPQEVQKELFLFLLGLQLSRQQPYRYPFRRIAAQGCCQRPHPCCLLSPFPMYSGASFRNKASATQQSKVALTSAFPQTSVDGE